MIGSSGVGKREEGEAGDGMWGQSPGLWPETSPWRSCSSSRIEKAQDRGFLEPLGPTRLCQQEHDREGTGRVWQRPTRSVRSCGGFTRSESGPVPPAQLLTLSPPVVCPSGSLWLCWDIPQPVLAPPCPCWQELLGLFLYSCGCLWSQTCCPGRTCPPVLCCVPHPFSTGWSSRRCQ